MNNKDNKSDEYESIPLREGEYLVHPDARIREMHEWITKLASIELPQGD